MMAVVRAVSFGVDPETYDRLRPGYPPAVTEGLFRDGDATVLDVACGTGLASRLFIERGCRVLGVDPDPRMAAFARASGIPVEVAPFEAWDPSGRVFDLVVCAQAWWWLDRAIAIPKIVELLKPQGRLGVFWNAGRVEDRLTLQLRDVYERLAPYVHEPMLPGDPPADAESELRTSGLFQAIETRTFEWTRRYTSEEWAATAATFSEVIALPDEERIRLLTEVKETINEYGGFRDAQLVTILVTAKR